MGLSYGRFFEKGTGHSPFPFQQRLVDEAWPDMLGVPTGLGKTAAVTLAWLYRRRQLQQPEMPRRLVWCLPMRVLVEQTVSNVTQWLERLDLLGAPGDDKVAVHRLMGGEPPRNMATWSSFPEQDAVLIGTQDMLLSRALMRGYGMSRYRWPVDFALLHTDALWVFDEVQLMGAGLTTSAQLEGLRRTFSAAKRCRSLWLSATLNPTWLNTIDLAPHAKQLRRMEIDANDRAAAADRIDSTKPLQRAELALTAEAGKKAGRKQYIDILAQLVLQQHSADSQTLVILNRVDRAQDLFRAIRKARPAASDLLVHARFRAAERQAIESELSSSEGRDRIVVATQAIEAGVDVSSRTLITELGPWASMVQRFGRCNRYGEWNNGSKARITWINVADEADVLPYSIEQLAPARAKLESLTDAGPTKLHGTDEARPLNAVLRRKDLLELFNTDPDLSGFDVDVSDYIRDSGLPSLQVFWRDFEDPNEPDPEPKPGREELCQVSMSQARHIPRRDCWFWDALSARWRRLDGPARPGMVLMLKTDTGGYDPQIGFDPALKETVQPVNLEGARADRFDGDDLSFAQKAVPLSDHLANVARLASELCDVLDETEFKVEIQRAARWHDVGKSHEVFDASMHRCEEAPSGLLAKSNCPGPLRHGRSHFRHELASMLAWLEQHDNPSEPDPRVDLIAYLIAAHHGKVRTSLRAMPDEKPAERGQRFARGVWEGDQLPGFDFDGERTNPVTLNLAVMELGLGDMGRSWAERVQSLLTEHGPFRLAWLESLVRIADWRASALEQEDQDA